MEQYQFSNVEVTDQFISANVYKNNNYLMKIGAETLHIQHTQDIDDELYKEFRAFALNYLDNKFSPEEKTSFCNIINLWDYKKKPL